MPRHPVAAESDFGLKIVRSFWKKQTTKRSYNELRVCTWSRANQRCLEYRRVFLKGDGTELQNKLVGIDEEVLKIILINLDEIKRLLAEKE